MLPEKLILTLWCRSDQMWCDVEEYDRKGKDKIDEQIRKEPKPCGEAFLGHWSKPQPGWLKINTDASFLVDSSSCHWGPIVREWKGKTLFRLGARSTGAARQQKLRPLPLWKRLRLSSNLNAPIVLQSDCNPNENG